MLSLRDRIIICYATAPEGFSMSSNEILRKFGCEKRAGLDYTLARLMRRGVLARVGKPYKYRYTAGPALLEELGGVAG